MTNTAHHHDPMKPIFLLWLPYAEKYVREVPHDGRTGGIGLRTGHVQCVERFDEATHYETRKDAFDAVVRLGLTTASPPRENSRYVVIDEVSTAYAVAHAAVVGARR